MRPLQVKWYNDEHWQLDLEHHSACTSSMEHLSGDLQPLQLPNGHKVMEFKNPISQAVTLKGSLSLRNVMFGTSCSQNGNPLHEQKIFSICWCTMFYSLRYILNWREHLPGPGQAHEHSRRHMFVSHRGHLPWLSLWVLATSVNFIMHKLLKDFCDELEDVAYRKIASRKPGNAIEVHFWCCLNLC